MTMFAKRGMCPHCRREPMDLSELGDDSQAAQPKEAGQARELPPLPEGIQYGENYYLYTRKDMREYARAAQSAPAVRDRAAMIERIKDAVEGECGGLAINDKRASAILDYVLASAPAQPTVPRAVVLSAEFTRQDLGPTGTNYPHIRAMLGYIESLIAAAAPVAQGSKE